MKNINKYFALREKDNKELESSSSQTVFKPNCIKPTVDCISKPNIWFERWPNVSCYYVQSVLAISSVLSDSILWLTARNVTSSCPVSVDRCRALGARASHESVAWMSGEHPAVTGRKATLQHPLTQLSDLMLIYRLKQSDYRDRASRSKIISCVACWSDVEVPDRCEQVIDQTFVQPAEWHVNRLTVCLKQLIL